MLRRAFPALCLWLSLAVQAVAAPVFSTLAGPTAGSSFGGCPLVTGTTVASYGPCNDAFGADRADAAASIGHVGAEIHHSAFGGSLPSGHAQASYTDQVVFSGPTGTSVPVALNLVLAGLLVSDPDVAGLSLSVTLNDQFVGRFSQVMVNGGNVTCDNNGFIGLSVCKNSYSDRIVTATINVPLGVEVEIGLTLEASAGGGAPGSSAVEFLNSLDFVTGSDLFVLPRGFTANSASSFIVDNRFVGGGGTVPEPSVAALALLALAGASVGRRSRRAAD